MHGSEKLTLTDFDTVRTSEREEPPTYSEVAMAVIHCQTDYKTSRLRLEEYWEACWASYYGTPEAVEAQRSLGKIFQGDTNTDWRHRITLGKGYEITETIHGYFMQATFPTRNWFRAVPCEPGYAALARVVSKYTQDKLNKAKFRHHYELFLRQLVVCGTSCIALPWRYETAKYKRRVKVQQPNFDMLSDGKWDIVEYDKVTRNEPDFEVLDIFDVWLDPNASDINTANFVRRIRKTKAELMALIQSGVYTGITLKDVINMTPYVRGEDKSRDVREYNGLTLERAYNTGDTVELYEFWGDLHLNGYTIRDVCVLTCGKHVLRLTSNPYWSGRPFVFGTYTDTTSKPYGTGALMPVLGALHELNTITNHRLDALEIALDPMYTLVDDGVLNASDVYTQPGRVFQVADHNSLRPMQGHRVDTVTYTEVTNLEQYVDKAIGTGAMVSANAARRGERVTATEIQATKDAGGNRLSNVHGHITEQVLSTLLGKMLRLMQQFITTSEVVRIEQQGGLVEYLAVGAEELAYDFILEPLGADHILAQQDYIQKRLDFLAAIAPYPDMSSKIDMSKYLEDLLLNFGMENPEVYIKPDEPAPTQAPTEVDGVTEGLRAMGGNAFVDQFGSSPEGLQQMQSMLMGEG
jgi:hypothetical protein